MSKFAVTLFDQRQDRTEQQPDVNALAQAVYSQPISKNAPLLPLLLSELDHGGDSGLLQRYVLEEHYLYGRSIEDIAQDFAKLSKLLVEDLHTEGVRWLRHPNRAKAILQNK